MIISSSSIRYQALQDKFSPKAETLKSDYDQAMNHFEQCQVLTRLMHNLHFLCTCLYLHSQSLVIFFSQDAYATELFAFLSQEKEFAEKIHKVWSHCLYQYK